MFKIEYYQKLDKTKPVDDFINSLNDKLKAKTLRDLKLLQEFGNELRKPQSSIASKKDGIFELRSKQGSDISRIFYFFIVGKTIILTNGYIKKQNKISKPDLELAIGYKNDYIKRVLKK